MAAKNKFHRQPASKAGRRNWCRPLRPLIALAWVAGTAAASAADLSWPPVTAQTKPWTWWWWHGSAVDETNLARELQEFHAAGLGGVQITTIYGVQGAEAREIPYLSPPWLNLMGYTVDEAAKLGMGVDMSLGSGWCFGGPTVSDRDANAEVVVNTFKLGVGERLKEKFNPETTQALMAFGPDGKSIDLTASIATNGAVFFSPPENWMATNNLPPKTWAIYAISQKPSGQKVKRAAPGGEGWMVNPLYPQAMTDWLQWFEAPLANYHGSRPGAVFQDSYEYRTDWAPDFFAQFEKRRGYPLQTELPALFADTSTVRDPAALDHIGRVKYDYRRTVSEILARPSEPAWVDWAHQHGFSTIYQAHGTPGNWLDLYSDADLPETEMFHHDRSILISKFASSAAHTQGRPLVGAETGTWLKEHFTETLADLKYLADDMFLAGVNHIYYHGTCYSPADAPWPGWLFYASTEMNPRNSIWHDVPALNAYIARCQSILQTGKPDNDILLYWPVADFWSQPAGLIQPMAVGKAGWFDQQPIGKIANALWNRGYAFDYVSDAQLLQARAVEGKIQMPGGDYKVILVPECKSMPLETIKQLFALANAGGLVIFEGKLPADVSGLNHLERQRGELEKCKSGLVPIWDENRHPGFAGFKIGGGRIYAASSASGTEALNYEKEIVCEPLTTRGLSFIRRSFDGGWNYFVVNRTDENFDGWISLGVPANSFVVLDALTGNAGVASTRLRATDKVEVHIQLAAGQSVILRAFAKKAVGGPAWPFWQTNGQTTKITGNWNVKFVSGGPLLPADVKIDKLASWTTFPAANCQAFAGTARYETRFDVQNSQLAIRHSQFSLDLGDVRQSARVRLNGKDFGTLIARPFCWVVDNLKPTANLLEVEVTSVAANRIRDLDRRGVNWKYFKDLNLVNEAYRPFNAAQWPLTDCGLLGPLTLTPVRASE